MRNRLACLSASFCLLVWPSILLGQATGKVGVINIQEAIGTTQEGKKATQEIQKKYQPRQQELQRQQQEIQAIQDQLQKQQTTLSDEEQRRLSRELEEKQKIFKRTQEDSQADFAADRDEAIRRIGQKMVRIINDYAQQNGFSLILDDAQIPVYYAARDIDITEEIVKRYDAANPADVGTTGTPAASGTPPAPASRPGESTAKPATPSSKPK
jgi:outer membrane protein